MIVSDPNSPLGKGFIRGRSLPGPLGAAVTYCRLCEPLLLRPTPEAEAENIDRLFSQLVPAPSGPGWHWAGKTNAHGYGLVIPVGGTARHEFLAHRVMFDLFSPTGGHRVTEVLDHRDGDRLNTAIWNLEAVSAAENLRRRGRRPRGPLPRMWSYPVALCAEFYNLPIPEEFPSVLDLFDAPEPDSVDTTPWAA